MCFSCHVLMDWCRRVVDRQMDLVAFARKNTEAKTGKGIEGICTRVTILIANGIQAWSRVKRGHREGDSEKVVRSVGCRSKWNQIVGAMVLEGGS